MRSTDDQLTEILNRSERIVEKREILRETGMYGISAFVCIVFLVLTSVKLPGAMQRVAETGEENARYGSLLLTTDYMGYIVIGLLAFLLGVFATMIVLRLKDAKKK